MIMAKLQVSVQSVSISVDVPSYCDKRCFPMQAYPQVLLLYTILCYIH